MERMTVSVHAGSLPLLLLRSPADKARRSWTDKAAHRMLPFRFDGRTVHLLPIYLYIILDWPPYSKPFIHSFIHITSSSSSPSEPSSYLHLSNPPLWLMADESGGNPRIRLSSWRIDGEREATHCLISVGPLLPDCLPGCSCPRWRNIISPVTRASIIE